MTPSQLALSRAAAKMAPGPGYAWVAGVSAAVAACAVLALLLRSPATEYSTDVAVVLDYPTLWASDTELSLNGVLVRGSIVRSPSPCQLAFALRSRARPTAVIPVRSSICQPPDTFRDQRDVEVRAHGILRLEDERLYLHADRLFVKDGGGYELPERRSSGAIGTDTQRR